jgi:hypothetical protein
MAGEIDFRFSIVDPPATEPKRSIYRDLPNLPDPVLLGMTMRFFNNDAITLYFKAKGAGTGYTFTETTLGSLVAGTDAYINIDAFASRAKPAVETDEIVTVTLDAYSDAGYTVLKWTFSRDIHVVFINSSNVKYTVTENNFDDGTVQGWAITAGIGAAGVVQAVATDYVLSNPYALRGIITKSGTATDVVWYHSKTFNTPAGTTYAVINVRAHASGTLCYLRSIRISNGTETLIQLGVYSSANAEAVPDDIWMRIVLLLPASAAVDLRIYCYWRVNTASSRIVSFNMDDIRIVSI